MHSVPNGGKGKITPFRGEIQAPAVEGEDPGVYEFAVDVEHVLFRLMRFQDRYHVLRLKIDNRNAAPLALDPEEDRVRVELSNGTELEAILDLSNSDTWDQLSDSVRKWLAYPMSVEQDQEENLFLLFDVADLEAVPTGISVDLGATDEVRLFNMKAVAH